MEWYKGLADPTQPVVSADREAGDVIIGDESFQTFPGGGSAMVRHAVGVVMRGSEIRGLTYHAVGFADSWHFTSYGGRREVLRRQLGHEPSLTELRDSYQIAASTEKKTARVVTVSFQI